MTISKYSPVLKLIFKCKLYQNDPGTLGLLNYEHLKNTFPSDSVGLINIKSCCMVDMSCLWFSFQVVNKYCVSKVSRSKSRIQISSEVKYKKSVWGLVKSMYNYITTVFIKKHVPVLHVQYVNCVHIATVVIFAMFSCSKSIQTTGCLSSCVTVVYIM